MNQASQTLSLFTSQALSKAEIEQVAGNYIAARIASEPTLGLLEQIERAEIALNVMKARVRETVRTEYRNQGGSYGGIQLRFSPGRKTYDFSNDPEWVQLDEAKKQRETYLKALKTPQTLVDEETGETTRICPPIIKQGDDILSVSLL
ncbi:hypothetical protein CLV58_109244 [Spirosoma oryzae]|uniref:Uncharacterized protein n=1 Tax=Spirosoma oryzae TaxID=1469603 RepID=A0A2T0SYN1_9BACT|nr:hypothetical protein [Spirosoma oryzae]PRY38517.1 hypothetical protein CLV58_109244 [Spirosoma oryzae]